MNYLRFRENIYGWLLVAPFFITLVIFFLYAFIRSVYFSFTNYDLFNEATWVGIKNYIALFKEGNFILALKNTLAFSIMVTIIQTVLSFGLALLVNAKIKGKSFFRTAFYLPSIMSSAAITLIFIWFYQRRGFLNSFISLIISYQEYIKCFLLVAIVSQFILVVKSRLKNFPTSYFDPVYAFISVILGVIGIMVADYFGWVVPKGSIIEINWLNTHDKVGPMPLTLWAVLMQNIYTTIPTLMLLFLAGLQNISSELYEAAKIDGAKKWQQHWHITIPQLAPVTFVIITLGIIGTLQMFDQVALLGDTAPLQSRITLAYYIYHNTFPPGGSPAIGLASAAALILAAITLVVVYLQKSFGVKEKANA